jgi:regulator of replication initiation timing
MKEDGSYALSLTLENEDGARIQNAQTILTGLVGALSCDPLEFIAMKPKEQFDLLKKFVPGVDFDAIAKAHDADFAARTEVNRDAKARRAQAEGVQVPAEVPAERVDETALVDQLASAGEHNAKVERSRANRAAAEQKVTGLKATTAQKMQRAADLRAQADACVAEARALEVEAEAIRANLDNPDNATPAPIDTAEIQAQIGARRKPPIRRCNSHYCRAGPRYSRGGSAGGQIRGTEQVH